MIPLGFASKPAEVTASQRLALLWLCDILCYGHVRHTLFGLNYFIKFSAANRDGIFEALPQGLAVLKCSDCFIEGGKSSICNHQSISMALFVIKVITY